MPLRMPLPIPHDPHHCSDAPSTALAVLGPGLVGSYLGAAARASHAILGSSGRIRARSALTPAGISAWDPQKTTLAELPPSIPLLVCTRVHQTPWEQLPDRALAAQNGLGQPCAVLTCFMALDPGPSGVAATGWQAPRLVLARPARAWRAVLAAWRACGIAVEEVDDARPAQWEKAILNATVGPLCLATGLSMAAVWSDARLRALVVAGTLEGVAIAQRHGITIPDGAPDRAAGFFASVGRHRPSVLSDQGELPFVLGALLQHAARGGIEVPALARIDQRCRAARAAAHGAGDRRCSPAPSPPASGRWRSPDWAASARLAWASNSRRRPCAREPAA